MDVGISSAVFYPMLLEEAVDRVISLGFKKTEIFVNCEMEYGDDFIDNIKAKLDFAGVEVVSVHPYTSLMEGVMFFSDYQRRTQCSIDQYRRGFRAAQRLGAKYFTFHGDRDVTWTVHMGTSVERNISVLDKLSSAAADYGILLTQENVSWCLSNRPEYISALRSALGGKLGFTLDLKQARRANVDIDMYIDAMGSDLKNIHISDYTQDQPCLLPGNGSMDCENFLSKLDGIGYNGDLLIEVYSSNYSCDEDIKNAKNWLENKILHKSCEKGLF